MATEAEVRQMFIDAGAPMETTGETAEQRVTRITNQINSGQRDASEVEAAIVQTASADYGGYNPAGSSFYGGGGTFATSSSSGGSITEAQVRAMFEASGAPIAIGGETEQQRISRITNQINSGQRTAAEVEAAIYASVGAAYDPNASSFYGGTGSTGVDLLNVAGGGTIWARPDGSEWIVYLAPGTEGDPVYMAWEVSRTEDLQSYFGPGQDIIYSEYVTDQQWEALGVMVFGDANEIQNTSENPFTTWANDLARLAESQPWVLEPDYQALSAMAVLEGRDITQDELTTTDWWRRHSAAQRQWLMLSHGDPASAQQAIDQATLQITEQLRTAGGGQDVDQAVIDWLVMEMVQGNISQADVSLQIRALTDPFSGIDLLPGLAGIANVPPGGATSTVNKEQEVRSLLHTWLGPMFGQWSDDEIERIAGSFRNDPNAESQFIESLKDQRMVLLPEYQDRNISYQAIANTWKQWWMGQWGQAPNESSDLWMSVLRNNDTGVSGELMRREGLEQGINKVVDDANDAALTPTTGLLRSPV